MSFCFVFSGGRQLVLILGSRKQSLPCLLICEYRGTGITESIFNLTRIIENNRWIQKRLPSLYLKATFLWSKGATTITRSLLSITTMTIKFLIRKGNTPPCGTFVYDISLIPNCSTITNAKDSTEKPREEAPLPVVKHSSQESCSEPPQAPYWPSPPMAHHQYPCLVPLTRSAAATIWGLLKSTSSLLSSTN